MAPDVLAVETFPTGRWRENCYLLRHDDGEALLVDPGGEAAAVLARVREEGLRVLAILNTHAHYDHVGGVAELKQALGAPFFLHGKDHKLLRHANLYRKLFDGEASVTIPAVDRDWQREPRPLALGGFTVTCHETPGHTPGSVCLEIEGHLFTGDTLLASKVGRTDLPGGNATQLQSSLRALASLAPELIVLPGHGRPTTLGAELACG